MATTSLDAAEWEEILGNIVASQRLAFLAVASFTLIVYDYFVTFGQEVKYFWTGPWSLSRVLFLLNRYLCPAVLMVGLPFSALIYHTLSKRVILVRICCIAEVSIEPTSCEGGIRAMFIMEYVALSVIQGIIVLRIWYMFAERPIARLLVVCAYLTAIVVTAAEMGILFASIVPIKYNIPGVVYHHCTAPPVAKIWRLYLPNFILHTILFVATTWPILQQRSSTSPLMIRLVRDGGIFYVAVFAASAFTTVGSLRPNDPAVILPAVFSNFLLALSSVSVSRLIFSIRSLAAALSMDSITLLSTAELSRIRWKQGAHDGELIVEIDTVEEDEHEMGDLYSPQHIPHTPRPYTTRVGVYNDELLPGFHKLASEKTRKNRSSRVVRAASMTPAH
ncbi:uncharacterized protein C8Q71DRAFT_863249 [Rhodofomes roseus]|uniref:DUF6533 domain-containing protein n=1 Tax=Rhodofomes roseus TaxID=34475 RepID=A0ABQ8JYX3_9APHY|nr:uncharacterized protein C8Q71DRAFT_863249 [Rhodofomes roseus]KAH9829490.1 hypothetical protein C8Q71DRAFT_863249 [Rhodofomes roseus]